MSIRFPATFYCFTRNLNQVFATMIVQLFVISIQFYCASSTVVVTDKGPVKGFEQDGVHIFKGIPFAAPPSGELRWRAPQVI